MAAEGRLYGRVSRTVLGLLLMEQTGGPPVITSIAGERMSIIWSGWASNVIGFL